MHFPALLIGQKLALLLGFSLVVNTLAPGCVCSPQDMIYYFSEKYFPAHKKQAALQEIFNFVQIEEESPTSVGEASPIA